MATVVGIDIGTSIVKIAFFEYKAKFILKKIFSFPTPYSGEGAGKEINKDEFSRQLLSELSMQQLKTSLIGINIPSSMVKVMTVSLPKMSEKELCIAAAAEAKRKMVPPPGPKSIFEHMILKESVVDKVANCEVLVAETDKSYIDRALSLLRQIGELSPVFIGPICYSLPIALSQTNPLYSKDTALVDIGNDSIDIMIASSRNLYFYRNIRLGLDQIASNIAREMNIEKNTAKNIIVQIGVPKVDVDLNDKVKVAEEIMRQNYEMSMQGKGGDWINPLEVRVAWQADLENIVHEVRRSLVYYKEQSKGQRVENIFFLGGGANVAGMVAVLSKEFGGNCGGFPVLEAMDINFEIDDNAARILKNDFIFAGVLATAIVTVAAKKTKKAINFLPLELKRKEVVGQRQVIAIVAVLIMLAGMIFAISRFFIENKLLKESIAGLTSESRVLKENIEILEGLRNKKKNVNEKVFKIQEILKRKVISAKAVETIARLMPEQLFLNELNITVSAAQDAAQSSRGQRQAEDNDSGRDGNALSKTAVYKYKLDMVVCCVADYEMTVRLAEDFREKLANSICFFNIKMSLPKLEKMNPLMGNGQDVLLTQVETRTFTLEAELRQVEN
ncbi:MAG: pilus assembly protein PilM [Candidatus Omnitrophica bacterium]|nr:pilus assembly protein PilM [Candidatus Omnitrophota bacterium]